MAPHWHDYMDAARRKIEITAFHCEQLGHELKNDRGPNDGRPGIPIQAYFEGVVLATVAAIDQVVQAVNSAMKLQLAPSKLFEGAAHEIEKLVPEFNAWRNQPIGVDLRRIRTRMVHYSYIKSPLGHTGWHVEETNHTYTGPRDLARYANAALVYAQQLGAIADKLQNSLLA